MYVDIFYNNLVTIRIYVFNDYQFLLILAVCIPSSK